jgi:hypothetical protein
MKDWLEWLIQATNGPVPVMEWLEHKLQPGVVGMQVRIGTEKASAEVYASCCPFFHCLNAGSTHGHTPSFELF